MNYYTTYSAFRAGLVLLGVMCFSVSACGGSATSTEKGVGEMAVQITSSEFNDGGTIPVRFTCDGEDLSPPLAWTGLPTGTQSLALVVDDPDAPVGTWVHWVIFNLPADTNSLPEGVSGLGTGGLNSWRRLGYGGPCPPSGTHRYYFKLYALDSMLSLPQGASKGDLEKAMQGHVIAQGQLMGTYSR
jgi:Raf kinase inhibitor-like YbhB/YbcL family protein